MSEKSLLLEVMKNIEGDFLVYLGVAGEKRAYRIAGPKPWGGGEHVCEIETSTDDIVRFIRDFVPEIIEEICQYRK